MKKVCVVGTGYVGLVTGACLAELGNDVICLDIVEAKIQRLRNGDLPIYEPGLEQVVRRNVSKGRLCFTTDYAEAVADADYCFIAVNTPSINGGAAADMTYVESAANSIAQHVTRDTIIVNKSTMPVGSGDLVAGIASKSLEARGAGHLTIAVVSNPEFLREGAAVQDFLHPDRVVLGSYDAAAARRVGELYVPLRAPIVITDLYTAEMIKYASNAFLATKISFINEIARICDLLGADVKEVAAGMGYDKRIGRAFLDAGLGYGGSCFPKDVKALAHMADQAGLHPQLLDAVMKINKDQRHVVLDKLEAEFGSSGLLGKTVAVLGLAFKDNTDDMREAPAIDVIGWLLEAGAVVRAFDPVAKETAQVALAELPGVAESVTYCADEYAAAHGADAVVVLTEWKRFSDIDLERLRDELRDPERAVLIDGRNLYDPEEMTRLGFQYQGIGRGNGRRRAVAPTEASNDATPSGVAR